MKLASDKENSVTFDNTPLTALLIRKVVAGTENEPISSVQFRITDSSGAAIGPDGGLFTTDQNGEIRVTGLTPGATVVVRETKAADGFVLDAAERKLLIQAGEQQTITVENQRKGSLIVKKLDSVTREPLPGVEFSIRYADGRPVDDANGQISSGGTYVTNSRGEIVINGIVGTVVVTETRTIEGYTIDPDGKSQTAVVNPNDGQVLTFTNAPKQTLTLKKYVTGTTTPLPGVKFLVKDSGGEYVGPNRGEYVTDQNGEIVITNLTPGVTITAQETETVSGYVLDTTPQSIKIKSGEAQTMVYYNAPKGSLTIRKLDASTEEPLANAEFKVTTLQGVPVDDNEGQTSTGGIYRTNGNGEILLANLQPGTYRVAETKAPSGYVLDTTAKTVTVNANDAQTLTFTGEPLQSIIIQKYIQGTTRPLAGVTFLVTDGNGAPVGGGSGEYVTDANGRITISGLIPGTTIIAREVRTVKGYTLNGTPQTLAVGSGGSAVLAGVSGSSSGASTAPGSSMTFYDEPMSKLIVRKVIEGTDGEPLQGVTFRVTDGSGAAVGNSGGEYVTDEAGTFTVENLEQGETITVREVKTVSGFVLDSTPKTVEIANSDVYELTFSNKRAGSLTIQSLDALTNFPIPGVEYKVLYADGRPVDNTNGQESSGGQYCTDSNGEIHITGIVGTVVVTEEKSAPGYTMDAHNRRQTVVVNAGETQTLTFHDTPDQALTIQLYKEGTADPIANAQFLLTDSTGKKLGTDNGIFTTDSNGRFTLTGLKPGLTVKIKQATTMDGYLVDVETKTIAIKSEDAQTVTVYNAPMQTLTVRLYVTDTTTSIEGARFLVRDSGGNVVGESNGVFITDRNGEFTISGLAPGVSIRATQTDTISGYVLTGGTQSILIKSGAAQSMTFYNPVSGSLTIQSLDSLTNLPIPGTEFKVLYADGRPVDNSNGQESSGGQYFTDANGEIRITGIVGTVVVTEEKAASGYTMDANDRRQTVVVNPGETQTLTFHDIPNQALNVQLYKEGTTDPISGAQFLLTAGTGAKLGDENGVFTTDTYGRFVLAGLKPGMTVKIRQATTPDGWLIDGETKTIVIESGDAQTVTVYNAPTQTLTVQLCAVGTTDPIAGAKFLLTDSAGKKLGTENGVFTTDGNGRFTLTGLKPGLSVNVKQTSTPDGYLIDGETKTIAVESGDAQTVTVYNEPKQSLTVKLFIKGITTPIEGGRFLLKDSGGKPLGDSNGVFTTNQNGEFTVSNLAPGTTVTATQTDTIPGYIPDGNPQSIQIQSGNAQSMVFYNPAAGSLTIRSLDSLTEAPIPGTEFKVLYADGRPVDNANGQESSGGKYSADSNGEINITGIVGTIVVTEEKAAPGYTMDANERRQTVVVNPAEAQTLTFHETPDQALTVQLYKEGTTDPIANAQFLLTDGTGAKLGDEDGTFTTDSNGRFTITGLKPGVTVKIKQTTTADGWLVDGETKTITITIKSGNVQTVTVYNAPTQTLKVQLYVEGTTDPIAGVKFLLSDSSGTKLGVENGVFTTDANGRFSLANLAPGVTVKVKQTSTADGYLIDGDTHAIAIKSGDEQTVTVYNAPTQVLTVKLYVKDTTTPIAGAKFLVKDSGGKLIGDTNGVYTTDQNGEFTISGLVPGTTITATQTDTISGYIADGNPQSILIQAGNAQNMVFYNTVKGAVTIRKIDANTEAPLTGAEFKVTTLQGVPVDDNEGQTSTGGIYRTDENGEIHLAKLLPSSYRVAETKAPAGYVLDTAEQTVTVNANDHQTLVFKDVPLQSITIHKFIDGTNKPLPGVTFKLTFGDGAPVGGGNGEYVTDRSGEITINGLVPGTTIIAREIRTVKGYTLNAEPQTIIVGGGTAVSSGTTGAAAGSGAAGTSGASGTASGGSSMNFYDSPQGSLVVRAVIDGTDNEPLKGVTFCVSDGSGAAVGSTGGEFTTDEAGTFTIENLEPGLTINVREIKVPDGFVLNGTPKTGEIKSGEALELVFQNQRAGSLVIRALDSWTQDPVPGSEFKILYTDGRPVDTSNGQESSGGQYFTDSNGEIRITDIVGSVVVTEEHAASGYTMDANNRKQTVEVRASETQTLTFHDTPDQAFSLQLYAKGTTNPIAGARFQLTDGDGKKLGSTDGEFITDEAGRFTVSGIKPGVTVNVKQIATANGYLPDAEGKSVNIRSGDAQSVTVYNTPTQQLTVQLYVTGTTDPISGAKFLLTDSTGKKLGTDNGVFTTNADGRFTLSNLAPGTTVKAKQLDTADGFLIDGDTKTIAIESGDAQTVTVYNASKQSFTVQLYVKDTTMPIPGARFLVTDGAGAKLGDEDGEFTTDENGRFSLRGLTPGVTVKVKQTAAVSGYLPDAAPKSVTIKAGNEQSVTVYNSPVQTLTIRLYVKDSTTPIPGAKFLVKDSGGKLIGEDNGVFTTDQHGEFSITGLTPGVTITATQTATISGYILDGNPQSILIKSGAAQSL